jgi:hypothetical protein
LGRGGRAGRVLTFLWGVRKYGVLKLYSKAKSGFKMMEDRDNDEEVEWMILLL